MTPWLASIRDLAIVMGDALLDLPLLPAAEEEEEGGATVEEEVTGFEGDVTARGRQLPWRRRRACVGAPWREREEERDGGEE